MKSSNGRPPILAFILRWIARVAAVAMFGLFVGSAIAEGFPPLWKQPLSVQLIFAGWALIFIGYVIGWRRQALGGALVLAALVAMSLVELAVNGNLLGPAFLMWLVPGALYFVAVWADHGGRSVALG
jgi:hypothetical protein